jgi:hypothetical protein
VLVSPYTLYCPFDGLFLIEVAKGLSQLGLQEDFHFFWWESALRLILYYYIKERFIYFFPFNNYFLKMYRVSFILGVYSLKLIKCTNYKTKCNRCASVFIHRKWNIENEVPSPHRVHFSVFIHRKWNEQNQATVVCI